MIVTGLSNQVPIILANFLRKESLISEHILYSLVTLHSIPFFIMQR